MTPEANPTPAENPGENSAMREMRARIDAQNAEIKAANDRAAAAEAQIEADRRAKLEEGERLKLEIQDRDKRLADLAPLQERVQTYEAAAQAEYEGLLTTVPEDKRDLLRSLSQKGSHYESVGALRQAMSLLPVEKQAIRTGGQPSPVSPTVATPAPPAFDPKAPWSNAFQSGR